MKEKVALTLLMGSNKEKLDLIYELTPKQVETVVRDLLNRPNKFLHIDEADKQLERTVTGEDFLCSAFRLEKVPKSLGIEIVKYIFEYNRWEVPVGAEVLRQLHLYPQAEEHVFKVLAEDLDSPNKTYIKSLSQSLKNHNPNFGKYKKSFYSKIAHTKSCKTLTHVSQLILQLVHDSQKDKIYKEAKNEISKRIKNFKTEDLTKFLEKNQLHQNFLFTDSYSFVSEVVQELIDQELKLRSKELNEKEKKKNQSNLKKQTSLKEVESMMTKGPSSHES